MVSYEIARLRALVERESFRLDLERRAAAAAADLERSLAKANAPFDHVEWDRRLLAFVASTGRGARISGAEVVDEHPARSVISLSETLRNDDGRDD
jgi:hypothetical protein